MTSLKRLVSILRGYPSILLAYSGGIDSALLLELLKNQAAGTWQAVLIDHPGLTDEERKTARLDIEAVQGRVIKISLEEMQSVWGKNQVQRCYYCKQLMFLKCLSLAEKMKLAVVIDGSHLDDDPDRRPGMRVLDELGIKSPLREAGWNKQLIRMQARLMGIASWERPARACLATGIEGLVTLRKLERVTLLEEFFQRHAITPVRIRLGKNQLRVGARAGDLIILKKLVNTPAFQQFLNSDGVEIQKVEIHPLTGGATR